MKINLLFFATIFYTYTSFGQTLPADQMTDRLIVKFKDVSESKKQIKRSAFFKKVKEKTHLSIKANSRRTHNGADIWEFTDKIENKKVEELAAIIKQDSSVEYAEPDYISKLQYTPNDTYFYYQYYLGNIYGDDSGSQFGIGAESAWNNSKGANVRVAVLDTGYLPHPDLNPNILLFNGAVYGYDFVNAAISNDGDGADSNPIDPGDYDILVGRAATWHGTSVAGVIASVGNNSTGTVGVAFESKIVPVRVAGKGGAYDSDIASGIIWAGKCTSTFLCPTRSNIINISLGGLHSCPTTLQDAINQSAVPIVVAAGNDNVDASQSSPANCMGVIPVGSVANSGAKSSFSNYGSIVNFVAVGESIYVPSNSGLYGVNEYNYKWLNGTSFAAPQIAGILALIKSPNIYGFKRDIIRRMTETAEKIYCFDPMTGPCSITSPYKLYASAKNALDLTRVFAWAAPSQYATSGSNSVTGTMNVSIPSGTPPYSYTWSINNPNIAFTNTTSATPTASYTFPSNVCFTAPDTSLTAKVSVTVTDSTGKTSATDFDYSFYPCQDSGG